MRQGRKLPQQILELGITSTPWPAEAFQNPAARRLPEACRVEQLDEEEIPALLLDPFTNLAQQVTETLREYFRERLYRTVIPRNIRLAEAPSEKASMISLMASS